MPKRQVIEIPGITAHSNSMPIPLAVKIGNMVYTGSIPGKDPATDELGATPEDQIRLAFANMRRIIELAGGTTDDIAKVDVRIRDMSLRDAVNKYWVEMFPHEEDRPARHTAASNLAGNAVIQMEMIAVL